MNAEWITSWWNLIFVLPFVLALLYLGLYTVSGVTFGECDLDADHDLGADADGDLDAHASVDADTDADVDHDVDADHDLDTDHDADAGHDAEDHETSGGRLSALSWLGVGRVPLSILLMVLLFTWGSAGFFANAALVDRGPRALAVSLPLAAAVSLLFTRLIVGAIGRWLPLNESTARRRHALLGSTGEALFPIDEKFGMVSVRDATGDLYQVPCRLADNEAAVPKGSRVQLVSYNAKQGLFYVKCPAPGGAVARK